MRTAKTSRTTPAILWIALALFVVAGLGNHLHFQTCTGDCCAQEMDSARDFRAAQLPAALASEEAADQCCCCGEASARGATVRGDRDADEGEPLDGARSSCAPGCCVAIGFDIEMARLDGFAEAPSLPACVFATPLGPQRSCPPREFKSPRPFDRGPPRVDRCTALRACTVLLI